MNTALIALPFRSSGNGWLHRILWPQGFATDTSTHWLNQYQRAAVWWSLVAIASLDVVHPVPVLRDLWWCMLFVVWVVPWRRPASSNSVFSEAIRQLSALLFFSWVIYRTQTAVLAAINTWKVFDGIRWWELLSHPLQNSVASIVTAGVVVIPLQRVTGRQSSFDTTLATLSFSLILSVPAIISVSRWAAPPTLCAIDLYDAVIPLLVMGEAASLLGPSRGGIEAERSQSHGGALYLAVMTGRLNALAALGAFCALALLAVTSGFMSWLMSGAHLHEAPFVAAGRAAAFPATCLLTILAGIASWRSLDRAGSRHVVFANLATVGRIVIGFFGCAVGLFGLIFAPRNANELKEAIQNMGGSPWSIAAASPDIIRFRGDVTWGVRDALEKALASNPNARRLELDSPGGYVNEALAVAAVVEQHSLSTVVRGRCASACTEIFVAGKERILESGGQLGFHRTRGITWDVGPYETKKSDDQVAQQFRGHGLTEAFIRRALGVPSNQIWYPSAEELLAAGVITAGPAMRPAMMN